MITTVLFDLDGTLLPMDQDRFLNAYLGGLARKMASHGYDPDLLLKALWAGTGAMVKNDGAVSNESLFWDTFEAVYGQPARQDEPYFDSFYRNEFQQVQHVCGFDAHAADVISLLKAKGLRVALATNPLFPAVATHSRARWAGLDPEDFSLITTYENSRHCKPNPEYYRDILEILDVSPDQCLMIGNDVGEDMIAADLGISVFLLTDNLINKHDQDISVFPHGGFPELLQYLQEL